MLDYRAYKLLWLICLPLRFILVSAEWGSVAVAIMISASLHYHVVVRIVIACGIVLGAGIALLIVRQILLWFITTWFFWLVDVVPAKAQSVKEAKAMVIGGPSTWLSKKFLSNFGNWTEDDTDQFASLMTWRARLFCRSTELVRKRVGRWKEIYETTGKQPGDFTQEEQLKVVADLDHSWFEKAIINNLSFYWIVWVVIISIAIVTLDNSVR